MGQTGKARGRKVFLKVAEMTNPRHRRSGRMYIVPAVVPEREVAR